MKQPRTLLPLALMGGMLLPLLACGTPRLTPAPVADSSFGFRVAPSGSPERARYTFSLAEPSAILIVAAASGEAGHLLAPADTTNLIPLPAGRHVLVGNRTRLWPALAPLPPSQHIVVIFPPAPVGAPPSASEQRWPAGTRAEMWDEPANTGPLFEQGWNRSWSVYLVVLSRPPEPGVVREALAELDGRRPPATQVEQMRHLLGRGGIGVRVVRGAESP